MFKFVLLFALLAQLHGHGYARDFYQHSKSDYAPSKDAHAKIVSTGFDLHHDGFKHHLKTSNGIKSHASGDAYGNIHGAFEWISPEGEHIAVNYIADKNGYQPDSAILPTPPPIPEAILKSLKYNKSHEPKPKIPNVHYNHKFSG